MATRIDASDAIGGGCALGMVALMAAAAVGWVLNVVKIFATLNDPLTGMFVGRVLGVFLVPIGCIVGWL